MKTTYLYFSTFKYFNSMILFLSKYYNIKLSLIMQLHVCQFNTADVLLLAMNLLKLRGTINSSFTFQKVTCSFHY